MLRNSGSCYADALEIAFGIPAVELLATYKELLPNSCPETEGFHPSVVNLLLFEELGTALSEIHCRPVYGEKELDPEQYCAALVLQWFELPGFRAIVQGPRVDNGEEHAVAFVDGKFIDSVDLVPTDSPNIKVRSVWVLSKGAYNVPTPTA